jgi:hypothetical protein
VTGIQLTYDFKQDRLLLRSGIDIDMPDWWVTRREVCKLLGVMGAVTTSQYETEKMLDQFSSKPQATGEKDGGGGTYNEFHQAQAGESKSKYSQSPESEIKPSQYPLAITINVDMNKSQGIKLTLLNEFNKGACLEFSQEGLYRFNDMLRMVSKKARWI